MKKKILLRSIFVCLLAVAMLSTSAFASTQANQYILATNVSIGCQGNGVIAVACTVTATDIYPDVGVHCIQIYKEGGTTPVFTRYYSSSGYSYLMGHNTFSHTAVVTYQGTIGQRYYAKVTFYAGTIGVAGGTYSMNSAYVTATQYKS